MTTMMAVATAMVEMLITGPILAFGCDGPGLGVV